MLREEQRFPISKINIVDKQNESQIYNQVLKIFCYQKSAPSITNRVHPLAQQLY